MKERNQTIHFNHGYLCEMLRNASDTELANVIEDVKKIQAQREESVLNEKMDMISIAIKNIINTGYTLTFINKYETFAINKNNFDNCHICINKES